MLKIDEEKNIQFCPFCGAEYPKKEGVYDYQKYVLKHKEQVRQQKVKEGIEAEKRDTKTAVIGFASIFLILIIIVIVYSISKGMKDNKLEATVAYVQQLILDGDYEAAELEAQNIRVEKDGFFDDHYKHWENTRKDLLKLIKQKKKEAK